MERAVCSRICNQEEEKFSKISSVVVVCSEFGNELDFWEFVP